MWVYTHDADRRLTKIVDPSGNQTLLGYNGAGALTSLTDPNGNITTWNYDVEGRIISKQYADTSAVTFAYENTTSRLKSVLDALGQTKQYSYTNDDRLAGVTYLNTVNPTPNVTFSYDPYFPRLVSMTDGNGTTQYAYVPTGSLGALQLLQETRSLSNSTIAYGYDPLGRLSSRAVGLSGAETFQYDTIGRPIGHVNDLGSFSLSYLGQTSQITTRQLLPLTSNLVTNWSYLPNNGDRRLAGINNVGLSTSQFSTFQFTTTAENFIATSTETSDAATVYPSPDVQTASYNNLNQLANLSGQALSFDANGNLLSDGQRNYRWDAENRLVGISYPGQSGKATSFSYDGLSRRTAIVSTPVGGGSAVATSYIWCGSRICQARNASNSVTREYFAEGEFVPGSSAQPYFYGPDQIASVRRVFASVTSAPAYSYDPYGKALQSTAPLTDFGYAGMFYNSDSGLYLTQYRAYDPAVGRWLSRDPIGEVDGFADSRMPTSITSALGSTVAFGIDSGNVLTTFANVPNVPTSSTGAAGDKTQQIVDLKYDSTGRYDYHTANYGLGWVLLNSPNLVRLPSAVNLYAYANGDPIDLVDPTGLASFCAWVRQMCFAAWCAWAGTAPKPIPQISPNPLPPITGSRDPRK